MEGQKLSNLNSSTSTLTSYQDFRCLKSKYPGKKFFYRISYLKNCERTTGPDKRLITRNRVKIAA